MSNLIGFWTLLKREVYRFMQISTDTLFPPVISSLLFLFIFKVSLGSRIPLVQGIAYEDFIIPGLIMLNVITTTYGNTSVSIYLGRFVNSIQEVLVAPLSYFEMVLAITLGGILRGILVALSILAAMALFVPLPVHNLLLFIFFILGVSTIFSSFGIVTGLRADRWDQLGLFPVFIITPLTFLGGVFHSLSMLPPLFQTLSRLNAVF